MFMLCLKFVLLRDAGSFSQRLHVLGMFEPRIHREVHGAVLFVYGWNDGDGIGGGNDVCH